MSCLAIIAITASMIVDGDTVRAQPINVRLTGEMNAPFDAPETWKPECRSEAKLGAQATGLVRALMPGNLCIIGDDGGYGRDLGILYGSDGVEVSTHLFARGLAKRSKNADWCG